MRTRWWSRPDHASALDGTLKQLVVWFRVLGWAWMVLLVVLTLASDDGADRTIVVSALVAATAAVVGMAAVAFKTDQLGSLWYVSVDGAVTLFVGAASSAAGAADLFHGGFLISWIVLAAYAGGRFGAFAAALVLTVEQVVVHLVDGRGVVATGGSVIFFIFAFIGGWTVDTLRLSESERSAAVEALARERDETARYEERALLADQMHDTVLQALHAIRLNAEDADEVRYLSRRQERELRRYVGRLQSHHKQSLRVALLDARDGAEEMYRVEVEVVIRHDAEMSPELESVVDAAREAMLNAAAHSGASTIEMFSEIVDDTVVVNVRDRGRGMDVSRLSPLKGIGRAAVRLEEIGGTLELTSSVDEGTECTVTMPIRSPKGLPA